MPARTKLTTVETVLAAGSWLFTVRGLYGEDDEVVLVPCEDSAEPPVQAWINRCTHEAQRLDMGRGVAMRGGRMICPKHGSLFDACSGYCDNGEAADTTLPDVDIEVEDGDVYLTDDHLTLKHAGGIEDDDGPSSTSHLDL